MNDDAVDEGFGLPPLRTSFASGDGDGEEADTTGGGTGGSTVAAYGYLADGVATVTAVGTSAVAVGAARVSFRNKNYA